MMNPWNLPVALEVAGTEYEIRTDFRAVLDIISAFGDPELPDYAKNQVMLEILYVTVPPDEHLEEAAKKAIWFIDCGRETDDKDDKPKPRTMDWEQDAAIIFPAVNKIAGYETRNPHQYTHWWTFMGYFNEIGDGLFSQVLSIRQKKAKGKKLEKWEQEFYTENRELINLKANISEEERDLRKKEQAAVDALFW